MEAMRIDQPVERGKIASAHTHGPQRRERRVAQLLPRTQREGHVRSILAAVHQAGHLPRRG
ncbi:hypothetical protein SDC9_184405 [bioreactor metagenome]|uniref:Uncharacterized protein n=1 Tax=bioreactor metagenome TaxID=1076179 RepID=A0A645HN70_9ZZZZ